MKTITTNNNLKLPQFGLGTWLSDKNLVYEAVKYAIEIGYRHIDCAWIYQNENEVGQAIKECIHNKIIKREDLWITSKLWNTFHEPHRVELALNESLKALQLEYLDLYLIHWPVAQKPDADGMDKPHHYYSLDDLPNEKTWTKLESLYRESKIRAIGVSNFSISKLEKLVSSSQVNPVTNQVELNPYNPQPELLQYCASKNICLTGYSPLGSAGRPDMMKASDEPHLLSDEGILDLAQSENCTPGQLLIAWAMKRGTAVIPKSTNPKRILENFEGSHIELKTQTYRDLNEIQERYRFCNPDVFMHKGITYTEDNFWI